MFINYIDRGNLATAAPLMQDTLKLSSSEIGVLLAAFYYGYVAFMAPVGWMAERYGAQRVLAAGALVWSIATISTGFATGFTTLLVLRVLLGIGESVAFPCMSKVLASTVEVSRLGVANGILSFGYLAGPAVGTLLGGYLMVAYGWQPVFIVFGCISLVWLWPWLRIVIAAPNGEIAAHEAPPSFRRILRQRALWGASLGHFAANYSYYFILSWLPFYLVKARGFSMGSMAAIASWAYLLNALSALFMGWVADRWIRTGRSADAIYTSWASPTCLHGWNGAVVGDGLGGLPVGLRVHHRTLLSRGVCHPPDHGGTHGVREVGRRAERDREPRWIGGPCGDGSSRRSHRPLRYRLCARRCRQYSRIHRLGRCPPDDQADTLGEMSMNAMWTSRNSMCAAFGMMLLAMQLHAAQLHAEGDPDWTVSIAPFRIADNFYYVGSRDLASYLIVTPVGDVLINSSLESSVPLIRNSVETLGFKFKDIRILLVSHAHWDHAAGSAGVKRLTGAKYMVMDGDVPVVESGGAKDFAYADRHYPVAKVDRVLHDGDEVRMGDVVLVAHKTPGHTKGCTTWAMRVTDRGRVFVIVGSWYVNPGYQLVDRQGQKASYPGIAADFKQTFSVLQNLPCEIFLGAHGSYFGMQGKLDRIRAGATDNVWVDPEGYQAALAERKQDIEAELARQSAAAPPRAM
jgi:metallo-beta-lactamase class B